MEKMKEGAEIAVQKCMDVTSSDTVLIVFDESTKDIGLAIKEASLDKTNNVKLFDIDQPIYGGRPLKKIPKSIEEAIKGSTVSFFLASALEGELSSFRLPFIHLTHQHTRHAHMVSVNKEIMEKGMCVDYDEVARITRNVLSVVKKAKEIRVTTSAGTDFVARFSKNINWIACPGKCREVGEWENLPSGEVYTAPSSLVGRLVVDGTIGDWIGQKYKDIVNFEKTPLIVEVDNNNGGSYIQSTECENEELFEDFKKYISSNEFSSRVGELGIGTNIFLNEIIGRILHDEKLPTVHIAFGDPYDARTGAGWSCNTHADLVMRKCSIFVDGQEIMKEGNYTQIITG